MCCMTLRGIHLHVHAYTCMFVDVLKLFCEDQAVRQFSPAEKIKSSDLREDIADEVIEINISQLQPFFSEEAWPLVRKKGEPIVSTSITVWIISSLHTSGIKERTVEVRCMQRDEIH